MSWIKNNINKLYAIGSSFSIAWYIFIIKFMGLKCITNHWLAALFFSPPIICTFGAKYKKSKYSDNENFSKNEIILDFLSILAIDINIYTIAYYINSSFFGKEFSPIMYFIDIVFTLLPATYSVHVLIKKIIGTTYSKSIIIILLILFFGWINSKELTLIAIFSIILNTTISIDARTKLISFLKKKEIGKEIIWKQNIKGDLTDDELKGKFIAQKITIYIIIAMLYIVIKFTEDKDFGLYLYAIVSDTKFSYSPSMTRYLYKGTDRILISILFFLVIYFEKGILGTLKKIFQPQDPNS